jgi:Fur family ferric uptake transcriptional regulator
MLPTVKPRQTKQRQAIIETLQASSAFLTVAQLAELLASNNQVIGLATIYRTVNALHQSEELDSVTLGDGQLAYRLCNATHHHHLRCTRCGITIELVGSHIEDWAHQVGSAHGFSAIEHTIELTGICQRCTTLVAR